MNHDDEPIVSFTRSEAKELFRACHGYACYVSDVDEAVYSKLRTAIKSTENEFFGEGI